MKNNKIIIDRIETIFIGLITLGVICVYVWQILVNAI